MSDLRQQTGSSQVLRVPGKRSSPAAIPHLVPVLRAVHAAVAGRRAGPLLAEPLREAMGAAPTRDC